MSAKFAPGDIVEVIAFPDEIFTVPPINPGQRGVIDSFWGQYRDGPFGTKIPGPWWACTIDGQAMLAAEDVLRKVPPDAQELVRWDQCDWRPSRSLVEA